MFNNYGNYGNTYTPYAQSYQMYQPQRTQENPFEVRFGTLDEAKAYIVAPTRSAMFIDRANSCAYIKSADNMGNPLLEGFKYTRIDNYSTDNKTPEFDTTELVRKDDIKDFVTTEQLKNVLDEKLGTIETDVKKLNRLNQLLGGEKDGE